MDYEYIKNFYRLVAADLSRKTELDTDPKAIQRIEFIGQLQNEDGINADRRQSMVALKILEKTVETKSKLGIKELQQYYKRLQIIINRELN